jgi:lipid II:glycine glycyltransferase (peptidoglycan interpeptide bridge formation enzyme)
MIKMKSVNASQVEWRSAVSVFLDLSLLQTWEYAEAKTKAGSGRVERLLFLGEDGEVIGACQCIVRQIPVMNRGLVWINRGPMWKREGSVDRTAIVEMLSQLRHYWVADRHMYLLVAPTIGREDVPENIIINGGFTLSNPVRDWASARLDLSQSSDLLRKNLQQKWRNCLNKAEREGLQSQSGVSPEIFHDILNQYDKMLKEKNLKGTASPSFLEILQDHLQDESKLWGLIAKRGEETVGGILIARYGNICEYLVGVFNENGKKVNAGNYLLWQAIGQMKELGYRWFDLGGMNPETTPKGIFHFKSGVNGVPYRYFPQIEGYDKGIINSITKFLVNSKRKVIHKDGPQGN